MNTEKVRAEFEAWGESIGFCVTGKYAETVDVLCAESAFKAGYKAALQSQDREDAVPYRIVADVAHKLLGVEQYERFMGELDHARRAEGGGE